MWIQRGFSLIELLIVVAIILVIAAIAIPHLLQARISANEASAVSSIQAIRTAEVAYYNAYPNVGYAASLANLGGGAPCTPSALTACVLDNSLANAGPLTPGKSGYVFAATGAFSGVMNTNYVAAAMPVSYGHSGFRLYCQTDDGLLRSTMAAGAMPTTPLLCNGIPPSP